MTSWVDRAAALRSGLGRRAPRRAPGPLVVMYHGIGGADGVAATALREQLEALVRRRRVVPLREAARALGTDAARDLASITFDDGYRDFATRALPELDALGLHATLFVPTGHVGGWNAWDEGRAPRREILSEEELRALPSEQVAIGAHGYGHVRMAALEPGALRRETAGARERLEDLLGRAVELFAYPFGQGDDFDARAEEAVRSAGFAAACSTRFGRGSRPGERYRMRRVGIEPGDDLATVARKLDGAYDWVAWKEAAGLAWRRLGGALRPAAR